MNKLLSVKVTSVENVVGKNCGVWDLWCAIDAVFEIWGTWESQFVKIAVFGSCCL